MLSVENTGGTIQEKGASLLSAVMLCFLFLLQLHCWQRSWVRTHWCSLISRASGIPAGGFLVSLAGIPAGSYPASAHLHSGHSQPWFSSHWPWLQDCRSTLAQVNFFTIHWPSDPTPGDDPCLSPSTFVLPRVLSP